jgi:hypothetical protein
MLEVIEKEIVKPTLIKDLDMMFATESSKQKKRYGIYKCGFCGEEFRAQINSVKDGNTKSCGCHKKRRTKEVNTKHGLRSTRLYNIWSKLKGRVLNPKNKQYNDYGGRGITICDEWLDVQNFYDWAMANGYSDELTIDRIDNDEGYFPENCRWTTQTIQTRNQRVYKNNTSGYKGVCYLKNNNKYKAVITINKKSIYLGLYPTPEEGAIAYNNYIIENNLEGFILNEITTDKTIKYERKEK